jgi:hypothetical protein
VCSGPRSSGRSKRKTNLLMRMRSRGVLSRGNGAALVPTALIQTPRSHALCATRGSQPEPPYCHGAKLRRKYPNGACSVCEA